MKARNTLILVLVALALGGYLVFYESKQEIKEPDAPSLEYLFDFSADGVSALEIRLTDKPKVSLSQSDGTWHARAEGGKDYEVSSSLVGDYIETLRGIQATGLTIEEGAVNLKSYGFDEPSDEIIIHGAADGREWEKRLLIGNETPIGSRRYVTNQDGNRVLMLDDYIMRALSKQPSDFRSRDLFSFERQQVARAELTHHEAGKLVLERGSVGWQVVGNENASLDQAKVDDLLGSLERLRINAFTEEGLGDGKKFGLDAPTMSYRLLDAQGAELALLQIGNRKKGTSGDYYAVVPAKGDEVFLLDALTIGRLPKTLDEFEPEPEEAPGEIPLDMSSETDFPEDAMPAQGIPQ